MADKSMLILPAGLATAIIDHARNGLPDEVCGLVAGRDGVATAVYPGRNISPTPADTYELDHDTLARVFDFEDAGLELVAIYHSHPHGPDRPSPTDIASAAYPDSVHLIVSLVAPDEPKLMGFRINCGNTQRIKTKIE